MIPNDKGECFYDDEQNEESSTNGQSKRQFILINVGQTGNFTKKQKNEEQTIPGVDSATIKSLFSQALSPDFNHNVELFLPENYFSPSQVLFFSPDRIAGQVKQDDLESMKKADMWSLGIMLFILLIGKSPYQENCDMKSLYSQIKKGHLNYHLISESRLPTNFQDLLLQFLQQDTLHRFDATEAINHPFFQEFEQQQSKNCQGLPFAEWGVMSPEHLGNIKRIIACQ